MTDSESKRDTLQDMPEPTQQLLRATSVRLHPQCLAQIATMSKKSGLSRSDIIRASINVMSHAESDGRHRLAVVDVHNRKGSAHFKVTEWVDYPAS